MSQPAETKSAKRPSLPTRRLYRYLIILPIAAGILAGASWLVLRPRTDHFYTDGRTIHESAATAPLRDILWQPPAKVGDLINSADNEYEPRLSADGMTLYFVRGKAGSNADIFYAERTPEGWTTAQPLAPVNTTRDELGPAPSADGRSLYFYSDRPGGFGGYDLWVIRRGLDKHSDFGEATNLGPTVNSEFNDYGPVLSPDGRALYFASNRPRPDEVDQPAPDAWPATVREDLFYRTYDLYCASISEGGISPARPLSTLNTPYNEGAPAVSPFDDFLYFASDRPGGEGGYDLYRSRRLDGRYEPATNLGTVLNTPANELDPGLAMGGYALYFSSDRPSDSVATGQALPYHIYRSTSREVFSQSEVQARSFDWAAVWAAIAPNLLWMLLALFLLLLLLGLMRGLEGRRLSLLARCLLASLAAHLMLMLLFNVWGVTTKLGDVLRKRGAIRVALVASAKSGDLVSQIRGKFTDIETPQTPVMDHTRAVPQLTNRATAAMITSPIQHSAPTPVEPMKVDRRLRDAVVDQATRLLPTSRLSSSDHRPVLEVTIPEESERANHAESSVLNLPASPVNAEVTRAEVSRTLSRLAESPASIAVTPAVDAGRALPMFERSLTDTHAGSEAESSPPAMLPPVIADRWPQQDSMAELTLPQAERQGRRDDEASEPSIRVAAANPTPARSTHLLESATDVVHESLREITPQSGVPAAPSVSLAATEAPHRLAENIGAELGDVDTFPAVALPNVPLNDLALPDLEQPASTVQAESSWDMPEALAHNPEQVGRAPAMLNLDNKTPVVETIPADQESVDKAIKAALAVGLMSTDSDPVQSSALSLPAVPVPRQLPEVTVASMELPIDPFLPEEPPVDDSRPKELAVDAIGNIRGYVRDAVSGEAISEAIVRLDLPDQPPIETPTAADGSYSVSPPEMPPFFALSASSEGYLPSSENVSRETVKGTTLELDFALQPQVEETVAIEAVPEVHHLGDNDFDGRINSQFQKRSEGSSFTTEFSLSSRQLPPYYARARMVMLVKGVQRSARIRINDQTMYHRLDWSPQNGSFGELTMPFDIDLLQAGVNTMTIIAGLNGRDVDDFEFVNVQVHVLP